MWRVGDTELQRSLHRLPPTRHGSSHGAQDVDGSERGERRVRKGIQQGEFQRELRKETSKGRTKRRAWIPGPASSSRGSYKSSKGSYKRASALERIPGPAPKTPRHLCTQSVKPARQTKGCVFWFVCETHTQRTDAGKPARQTKGPPLVSSRLRLRFARRAGPASESGA